MDEYARFAFLYDHLVGGALRPIHSSITNALVEQNCLTVIDLCCGTGLFTGLARKAGLLPSGVDISTDMLAIARQKHPSVNFLESDATQTPFPNSSFDATTISFALHEKPLPLSLTILEEAKRLTKPGGLIVVGDYRLPTTGEERLTGLGIKLVERMAGREHHACFKEYMDAGGTDSILQEAGLFAQTITTHMNGWTGVYVAEHPR